MTFKCMILFEIECNLMSTIVYKVTVVIKTLIVSVCMYPINVTYVPVDFLDKAKSSPLNVKINMFFDCVFYVLFGENLLFKSLT